MTEDTQDLRDALSTVISEDTAGGTGGGAPPPETGDENLSITEVLRKEAKAQEAAAKEERKAEKATEEPEAEKAEEPTKEDAGSDAKPKEVVAEKEGDDEAGEKEAAKAAQSEGKADKIPSRLLPKEREVWANVPNAVKAAWERMEREYGEANESSREAVEFHEGLKQYAEMAKGANTTVKDALDRYVSMDKAIAANFGQGMAQIAQAHGKNPTEAVAQFMRAAGVSPQQLGAYLQGTPAPQQQQAQRPQQSQPDTVAQQAMQRVQQLEAQLAKQQETQRMTQVENDIITPFANSHPRFAELQDDVAMFLNSGRIPTSLSPVERLEVAYDMAERINPTPVTTQPNLAEPAGKPASDAGKKSVRGAPASGQSKDADFEDETDLVALLRREARKLTA